MSLTLKFRYRFEAAHRLTSAAAPSCKTPHGHTWYATAFFRMTAPDLDRSAMAIEFSAIKSAWKTFLTETVDHSFFHNAADPLLPHLKTVIPDARLLPFPTDPTTEMIAGLFALKLKSMHEAAMLKNPSLSAVQPIGVHIQETPTNSITFRFHQDGSAPVWLLNQISGTTGWWEHAEPNLRELKLTSKN